jgi:flagellar hook protein FlgE
MSFQTGLSGLNVSSKSLDVIGNNIANANTVGFKSSRNEFSELVSSSLGAGGSGGAGIGAATAAIAQQFSQGNVNITGNSLDVAINGGGFFQITKTDGSSAFTRDGQFKLDKDGNIITNTGANLMGYPTDLKGVPTSITTQKMSIPTGAPIAASQTTAITAEFNLDARAKIAATVVPPTPIGTYGTSITTYDSQGVAQPFNMYFNKIDPTTSGLPVPLSLAAAVNQNTDQWAIYDTSVVDLATNTPPPIGYLAFDSTGKLAATYDAALAETTTLGQLPVTITPAPPSIVLPYIPTLDLTKTSQYGTSFNVSNLAQDGYTAGDLTGLSIDPTGIITTRYSNGQTQSRGQISLADFRNVQGLKPIGGGEYLESFSSGQPVQGAPGVGKFGELRAGAVEESNVDLTAELVNMMTAQRNYQANAQTIKTQDQVMQTLVNLR